MEYLEKFRKYFNNSFSAYEMVKFSDDEKKTIHLV